MKTVRKRVLIFVFVIIGIIGSYGAEVSTNASLPFVSPMFGENMVLQRGKPNTIWGWTKPGLVVEVQIGPASALGKAGADGRWEANLMPPAVGGPYTMKIDGQQHVEFKNVLVGDVWLCGGQSNMELPLDRTRDGDAAIKAADCPNIRLFTVKSKSAYTPAPVVEGSWKVCSPKTITEDGGFSAVGYYFAKRIQNETNVPIGLIKDCLGGTPAESWTSVETLRTLKDFDPALNEVERLRAVGGTVYGNYVMPWYDEFDIGLTAGWSSANINDSDWTPVTIPSDFHELGITNTPAVFYFRRTVVLPDPLPTGKATIQLGIIEKMDTTYVNGHWVGASAWVENPRAYTIDGGVLKPGTNSVTIRVFKTKSEGGFESPASELKLVLGDKTEIPLAGEWKGKLSVMVRPPVPLPFGFENWPVMPFVLYDGMIAPVAPLAIAGVIWYQGEANAYRAYQYRTLLPAMIADWRKVFRQGDVPFYIVSLPAFMQRRGQPGDDAWAELREAQAMTATAIHNSGLAVTIDTGEADSIHPKDKKVVGDRLALCALANYYSKAVIFQGPTYASMERLTNAVKIHFTNADGGLVVKGDKPGEFSIAGADHQWHWADARIDGDAVLVSSESVPEPVAVRYAWQSNPLATLFNGAGLPAVPFRTDDWPESTENKK